MIQNIHTCLKEYGIMVNNDAVVRTNYYKYFHPKECLIQNGVLNRAVSEAAGKTVPGLSLDEGVDAQVEKYNNNRTGSRYRVAVQ